MHDVKRLDVGLARRLTSRARRLEKGTAAEQRLQPRQFAEDGRLQFSDIVLPIGCKLREDSLASTRKEGLHGRVARRVEPDELEQSVQCAICKQRSVLRVAQRVC